MKHFRIILVILLGSFVTTQCQKNPDNKNNTELPSEIKASIERRIKEGLTLTPSIALAIIDSSGVQYFNFGKTAKNGSEVDENTIYEIGSISKVFTGILLKIV